MHPTAAALALRGYRLLRRPPYDIGFQLIVQNRSSFYGCAAGSDGIWLKIPLRLNEITKHEEIAWSEIPDSLWATCDLEEAVRILES